MKQRKEVIRGVVQSFFNVETELNASYDDAFIGFVLDDDEIEIFTSALDEALENNK